MAGTRFSLGSLYITPGALEAFKTSGDDPIAYLVRHLTGDWGQLSAEDKAANEYAVTEGLRLLSAYALSNGVRVWIIIEADRSSTCILLPEEY